MENHHIQQPRQDLPTLLELLSSFFTFALSAVTIVAWLRAFCEYLELVIYFSDLVFHSYLDIIKFANSMVVWFFFCYVFLEKLESSFNSSVLPVFKLITGTLFIGKRETQQQRLGPNATNTHATMEQR
ncbi:hypothetical protein KCU93_g9299, partial [Aureobasidium melanogenum]